MGISYEGFLFPKVGNGKLRVEEKRDRRLSEESEERACRAAVRKRDKGTCRIPGCKQKSAHMHHIVYRSKGGRWNTQNICSLCQFHHGLVHGGRITIRGNADGELEITGIIASLHAALVGAASAGGVRAASESRSDQLTDAVARSAVSDGAAAVTRTESDPSDQTQNQPRSKESPV